MAKTPTKVKKIPEHKVIKYTRAEIRQKLLGDAPKPEIRKLKLFGMEIDLHQPTLRGILDAQGMEDEKERAVNTIVEYAYVPDTMERIFEITDRDVILSWPFTEELVDLQVAVAEMTGVDMEILKAEAGLKSDPLDGQS